MCFDADSQPPIHPIAGAAVDGARISLQAADGTQFDGFSAHPSAPTGAAVLILPDVRGLYGFYQELALRFAETGVEALAIDYFGRTAGTGQRGEDFDHQAHVAQTRYENLLQDMHAGVDELSAGPGVKALFGVGFCYGGRLAFLSGTRPELGLSGVIGFYGLPAGAGRAGMPAPIDVAGQIRCPVLGLFGAADGAIPPEVIAEFETALTRAQVEHELVSYPGAPHSFFDRKAADFAGASTDAWRRSLEFIRAHTPAG